MPDTCAMPYAKASFRIISDGVLLIAAAVIVLWAASRLGATPGRGSIALPNWFFSPSQVTLR